VNIILSYRKTHRLSQADFGYMVGVSQTRVSQWEHGEPLTPGKCPAIERVTGIPCESLRPDIEWRRDEEGSVTSYCVHINGDTE
jgi:DNA-binding transcriptional regulator YdaS (Cro superfamily)